MGNAGSKITVTPHDLLTAKKTSREIISRILFVSLGSIVDQQRKWKTFCQLYRRGKKGRIDKQSSVNRNKKGCDSIFLLPLPPFLISLF